MTREHLFLSCYRETNNVSSIQNPPTSSSDRTCAHMLRTYTPKASYNRVSDCECFSTQDLVSVTASSYLYLSVSTDFLLNTMWY